MTNRSGPLQEIKEAPQIRVDKMIGRKTVATPSTMLSALCLVVALADPLPALEGLVPIAEGWTASANVSQQSQPRNSGGFSSEGRSRIRDAISAVGLILVRNSNEPPESRPRPRGSAVVVREDGVIVTNYHVVARDKGAELYDEVYFALPVDGSVSASRPYRLNPILINKEMDLVLLVVAVDTYAPAPNGPIILPTIELGDSHAVKELDDLVIIGYPEKGGATVTVNAGTIEGKDTLGNWIKTDARLIHGNSGGAAVDGKGRLVGIPTKVIIDRQATDKNGDGLPDGDYALGAVGFLRPVQLVQEMLAQVKQNNAYAPVALAERAAIALRSPEFEVHGIVKSATDGKPIAGVAIGLVTAGTPEVSAENILTWGYTDPDGRFQLNRLVPAGHYTVQARTFGYAMFRRDVEVNGSTGELVIELRRPK
ncbi:MAG TPA: trypsin-like peptidase domain-containing protein [Blastocatellia bacterium]|nr:trypsin-like peptidase domain-containing protein [Blastocatellia bacterium]